MDEFKISKKQVLTEFYIRELPVLFYTINQRENNRKIEQINQNQLLLSMLTATGGMSPNTESVNELSNELNEQYKKIRPHKPERNVEEDPYEKLRRIQGLMAANKPGNRKG